MKKLKDILKESNVQIGKVYSNPYATAFVKENEEQEEPQIELSEEQKKAFLEAVKQYKKYGEAVYRNAGLGEVYESIKNMVEMAGKVTLSETEDWFDNVTVSRHMKRMGESFKVFEKTLKEVSTLQQRLESSYDEIGEVLGKYYEISEELDPVGKEDGDIDNDGDEDSSDEYLANRRKVVSKAIKNESMKLTDMISVNEGSISIDKKVTNIINSRDFKKFVNYFNSFYGKNGIYSSGKDIAEKDIMKGLYNVFKRNNSYEWGDGDSVDRELVRDELFKMKVLSDKIYKNEALSVNEANGEFVVYIEKDNGRKKLLHTKQSQRAANMFLTKNADKILNQSGIRAIGSMSKFHWEKDEEYHAENIKKTDMKTVTKNEWDRKHKDYKGMIKGQPYMMYMDKNGATVYGPVNIKESVNEAKVGDFEIGDFIHFKSKNKTGMVVSVKGNTVTINTPKGKVTGDIKDVQVLYQDNVNTSVKESVVNEAKYDIGMARKGNGITVYNRAEEEKGDYKNIAHISDNGVVKYYDKKLPNDVKKKIEAEAQKMKESVTEGKRRFNTKYGVGKSKYVINYHDGVKKHKDGSDFFDIEIFKNQKDLEAFKKALLQKGFVAESVNEGKSMKLTDMLNESFGFGELPSSKLMKMKVSAKDMLDSVNPKKVNEVYEEEDVVEEGRASAKSLLQSVIKGESSRIEGIKLSKEAAEGLLDWLMVSPYGKKFSNLPFHMLLKASFNWGLHRYIDKNSKEYKDLQAVAKTLEKK